MQVYIVLLKGINVGGHNKIKMDDLKNTLGTNDEIYDLRTYIQSGNIILRSSLSEKELEKTISESIFKTYGYSIVSKAYSKDKWLDISNHHPYFNDDLELKTLHVVFCFDSWDEEFRKELFLKKPDNEHCTIIGNNWFFYYPNGIGKSKFNISLVQKKLKINCSVRNWNTVLKLRNIVESY